MRLFSVHRLCIEGGLLPAASWAWHGVEARGSEDWETLIGCTPTIDSVARQEQKQSGRSQGGIRLQHRIMYVVEVLRTEAGKVHREP